MYKATVKITLRPSILDPQGKAAHQALQNLGLTQVEQIRIGKLIHLDIQAESLDQANEVAHAACKKLLANEVMENFTVSLEEK